jgi:hypothetical protein
MGELEVTPRKKICVRELINEVGSTMSLLYKKLVDICCELRPTEEVGGIGGGNSPHLPHITFMYEVVV